MATGLNPLLGYAAGALTILSPCVLPLVPIVLGAAAQKHRLGPVALAAGLVVSFTAVGFAVAYAGEAVGLDSEVVRNIGAVMLLAIGMALLIPQATHAFERVAGPLSAWAGRQQDGADRYGLAGQAAIGALLGLVWSPCVGPTLGAATVLAAQGENLGEVALTMGAFGLGIASVLLILAFATRSFIGRWRAKMLSAGSGGKQLLGLVIAAVGVFILTGVDRQVETAVVEASPDWLSEITTRY